MKKGKAVALYEKYYVDKNNEGLSQFLILADKYGVKSALYPGSYVHITPSFVFPIVTYVDTDKRAKAFFNDPGIYDYISQRKVYDDDPVISFHPEDYRSNTLELNRKFDLLISQYAGFISQYCKKYLKTGGLLLVNNSHGDAGMASIDESYQLIGVISKKGSKYSLLQKDLDSYFVPRKAVMITREYLEKIGRGVGYTRSPASYLFRRIK